MERELKIGKRGASVLIVISILALFYQIRYISYPIVNNNQIAETDNRLLSSRSNAEANLQQARLNHYFIYSEFDDSLKLYTRTLELNPVYIQAWISLGELFADEGMDEKARTVLKYADNLTGISINELWDLSLLAIRLDEPELAARNLAIVSEGFSINDIDRVFALVEETGDGRDIFIDNLNPDTLVKYFHYLMSKGSYKDVIYLWEEMNKKNIESGVDTKLSFMDYLVNRNNLDMSYSIWNEIFPNRTEKARNLIWNSSFEDEIMDKGFDWRIRETEGVYVGIDDEIYFNGTRSLKLVFNGMGNIGYSHISQLIPVNENSVYYFRYAFRSAGVSTRSGLYIELNCIGLDARFKTGMILGDGEWQKDELIIRTPAGCTGVRLTMKRDPINKLDSNIKGTVWLDDLNLVKVG